MLTVFAMTCRIGEALNPGPQAFGSLNPTGLMGKVPELQALPLGTYAVQESHLTGVGCQQFKRQLQWQGSPYQLCHGPPAPAQSTNLRSTGGKQTGVAFVSPHPMRKLHHEWSVEQHQTSRCHVTAVYTQHQWVSMGTVYGYSFNSRSQEVQNQTDELLQGLTKRIVDGAHGPRILAGDWNTTRDKLPQLEYWESQGWQEAQVLAQQKWHRPIQATCRHTTVKDFLYLSPEVVPLVQDVIIDWSLFPDHAAIIVVLDDFAPPRPAQVWRKPATIAWPKQPVAAFTTDQSFPEHPDKKYQCIMEALEQHADKVMEQQTKPPLSKAQKGRAMTFNPTGVMPQHAPVKQARPGDVKSKLTNASLKYSTQTPTLLEMYKCSLGRSP